MDGSVEIPVEMEGEYYDRNRAAMPADLDGPLGEDGRVGGPGVEDRGLFGRRHGHGSYDGECASAVGGPGYEGRPPMPYDGGYGDGYGGYEQRRPPPEVVYDSGYGEPIGYGGAAPPVYGESDVAGMYEDRGHHGGRYGLNKKDDDELDDERKHKHYAEAAAAAAIGYGLYERHQKNDAEEKLDELGYDSDGKKKHGHQFHDY